MGELRAIDVCAGAGGWAVAARGLPIRIEAAFDHTDDCLETYVENHPGVKAVLCDVAEHDFSKWEGVDLILGGIPCEPISVARNNVPMSDDVRDNFYKLIDKLLKLPTSLGAQWWCYEDVIQLEKHLPPLTPFFVSDSQYFSPQRRKRMYVGNLPKPRDVGDDRTLESCIRPGPHRRSLRLNGRVPGHSQIYNDEKFYPWEPDKKSPTVMSLTSRHDHYAAIRYKDGWRQPQWQELALLQGFPTDYVFVGSPTRVSKMVGQAVQIDTARAILTTLCVEAAVVVGKEEL